MDKNEIIFLNNNKVSKKKNQKPDLVYKKITRKKDLSEYDKISLNNLEMLGVAAVPSFEIFNSIINSGGSGLYMVDTAGGTLFQCASKGNAYIGSMATASDKLGQAALIPLHFNPVTLCITIATICMLEKFNKINKNIQNVINILEADDEGKLKSAFNELNNIIEEYKHSSNKQEYIKKGYNNTSSIISKVSDIKEKYASLIKNYQSRQAINSDKKNYVNNINKYFSFYQMAVYLLSLATYIRLVFNEDFSPDYLNYQIEELNKLASEQVNIKNKCLNLIKEKNNNIFKNKIFKLLNSRKNNDKNELQFIKKISKCNNYDFKYKIEQINNFYNKPVEFLVDKENIYIKK